MKVELFPFQKKALQDIRMKAAEAMGSYHRTHSPQVVSFTAPTGAGKTIIMAAFIESVLFGDENFAEQQNAIFVWLSDSPQLNEQSKLKLDTKADKIRLAQCVTVEEESFDRETFEDGHIYFLNTQKLSFDLKSFAMSSILLIAPQPKNTEVLVLISRTSLISISFCHIKILLS